MKRSHSLLIGSAVVLATLAALRGTSAPNVNAYALARVIEAEQDHVTAIQLAEWIRDRKAGLRVVDVRSDSEYQAFHIPTAEHVALDSVVRIKPAAGETLVLYSEGGAHAAQAWVLLRTLGHEHVYFLRGGLLDWMDDVLSPSLRDRTGNTSTDSSAARIASVSRYFGGTPHVDPKAAPPEASTGAAVAKIKRRGC